MKSPDGSVTTGLLTAVGYLKDNRLLPEGYDKEEADKDIAVYGAALNDDDFVGGGDELKYIIDVSGIEGPLHVTARLWYQPIGYRWAENLRSYPAKEPRQFSAMYKSFSERDKAIVLSTSSIRLMPVVDQSPNNAAAETETTNSSVYSP